MVNSLRVTAPRPEACIDAMEACTNVQETLQQATVTCLQQGRTLAARRTRSVRMNSGPTLYRASELIRAEEERHKAWLHDTVLQVLEYLATGGYGECTDASRLMNIAASAADELRLAIDGTADASQSSGGSFREALEQVVDEARVLSGTHVKMDVDDCLESIDPGIANEVIGAAREALTNVRKHAHARTATVWCRSEHDSLELRVIDDGVGFDPINVTEGIGIRSSIHKRIARCGGYVTIASAPERGTVVRVRVDLTGTESVA